MADHECPTTALAKGTAKLGAMVASHQPPSQHPLQNIAAPQTPYFTPYQRIPAGSAVPEKDSSVPTPKVFQPLQIRGLTLQNRIFVSPMCQYSAHDGHHTDWHLTHLGGIIQRGPGLTIVEATAVVPEGRITPEDSGLWKDSQIEPLKRIVNFAHSQNQKIAIQLAHAGRKASTVAPWIDRKAAAPYEVGGWPDTVVSTSEAPYDEHTCIPHTMGLSEIYEFKKAFVAAVKRALTAGFDAIEIHAAHGYFLHATLSAATNKLPAPYSGNFENRIRLVTELATLTRQNIPDDMPLLARIPGTDWMPADSGCWDVKQCVQLSLALADAGVDFLDVSSAGLMHDQKIVAGPSYQTPFAEAVKKALLDAGKKNIFVGTVGMITSGVQAEGILQDGKADAVLVARGFQKNPGLVWEWAAELNVEVRQANQIGWGFGQRSDGGVKAGHAANARG